MVDTVLTVNNTLVDRGSSVIRRISKSHLNNALKELGDVGFFNEVVDNLEYGTIQKCREMKPRSVEVVLINPYHSHTSVIYVTVINDFGCKDEVLDESDFVKVMSKLEKGVMGSYRLFSERAKNLCNSKVMAHSFRLQNFESPIDKQVLHFTQKLYDKCEIHRVLLYPTLETSYLFTCINQIPWPVYRGYDMPIKVRVANFNPERECVDWMLNT